MNSGFDAAAVLAPRRQSQGKNFGNWSDFWSTRRLRLIRKRSISI